MHVNRLHRMSDPTHVANEYQGQCAGEGLDNSQFTNRWYPSGTPLDINLCVSDIFIYLIKGRATYKSLLSTRKLMP